VTTTSCVGCELAVVDVRVFRRANNLPMVRFCRVCSFEISSNTIKGFTEVLNCAGSVDLVTLVIGVVDGELIVLKFVPTCFDLKFLLSVELSTWIADRELRILSMIVVGFSLVTVTTGIFWVVWVLSSFVDFFVASFKMADSFVGVSVVGVVSLVGWGTSVVDMAVIEFIILSMIETGFSVVLVWDADTFGNRFVSFVCAAVVLPIYQGTS
jgi:hypothetical protein